MNIECVKGNLNNLFINLSIIFKCLLYDDLDGMHVVCRSVDCSCIEIRLV